nr:hypothetical protein CFP56_75495 [Quercus suber]
MEGCAVGAVQRWASGGELSPLTSQRIRETPRFRTGSVIARPPSFHVRTISNDKVREELLAIKPVAAFSRPLTAAVCYSIVLHHGPGAQDSSLATARLKCPIVDYVDVHWWRSIVRRGVVPNNYTASCVREDDFHGSTWIDGSHGRTFSKTQKVVYTQPALHRSGALLCMQMLMRMRHDIYYPDLRRINSSLTADRPSAIKQCSFQGCRLFWLF